MALKAPYRLVGMLSVLLWLSCCGAGAQSPQSPPVQTQPQPAPGVTSATPQPQGFTAWLADFKREALAKGISQNVLDNAFAAVTEPSQGVLERDHTQPEKTKSFDDYARSFLKENKVVAAQAQWQSHEDIFERVEQAYQVPAPILLALWQTESNFGKVQGNFSVIESLATLAYDGRRSAFFRTELLNALTLMQQEHIGADALIGSWAGAMGQTQFMPSSFLSFAVDFDGDGKKDIWNSDADALASMANYLHTRGWNHALGWGIRVQIPDGADANAWAQSKEWHSFAQWRKLGLKDANGHRLPKATYETRLVLPDNDPDNAFLVTTNYDVIMDWNHSTYFATGIGMLSDAIARKNDE